jgi:glutamate-1-semialdehyde 2,1-aminomutase
LTYCWERLYVLGFLDKRDNARIEENGMTESQRDHGIKRYCQSTFRSRTYSELAADYIGGRTTRELTFFNPYPPYIVRGEGFKIFDVDGNERVDFFNNASSLILGHAHPVVVKAVQDQLLNGTAFHGPTPWEVELAKRICERVRSIERVRFTNSGTEAVMIALRAAKAFTGKVNIGKFEGGYHGTYDPVCVSVHPDLQKAGPSESPRAVAEPGISEEFLREVVVMPFNNTNAVERIVKKERDNLACVIVEPMMGAAGIIPARPGFLADLRKITLDNDVLLIFDEVQTFRHSWGGAQELCGVTPDLTVLAKLIGGGFPVGAFGGRKDIMEVFDSISGKARVTHGGTFNGNPISMIAGIATLEQLSPRSYSRLNRLGEEIRRGFSDLCKQYHYNARVTGEASFMAIHFRDEEVWDYRGAARASDKAEQEKLFFHFLNHGIFPSKLRINLSMPMRETEIHEFLNVFEDYVKKVGSLSS